MAAINKPQVVEFYYDIVCPFAYIASLRLPAIAAHASARISYQPVLLGGIYRATQAQQGAHGSASDVANPTKRAYGSRHFARTCRRLGVPLTWPDKDNHPVRSVDALRLLYGIPDDDGDGRGLRAAVSQALYRTYWVEGRGKEVLGSREALLEVARKALVPILGSGGEEEVDKIVTMAVFDDPAAKAALEENTAKAVARGAPGVPGFWVPDVEWVGPAGLDDVRRGRFFWGQDRMHFLHAALLQAASGKSGGSQPVPKLLSLVPRARPLGRLPGGEQVRLEFWYDFSSPWAYLGWSGLARLQRQFGGKAKLEIVLRPVLLGVVFREIGAPMLPLFAASPQKRAWSSLDMQDWERFWQAVDNQDGLEGKDVMPEPLRWPDVFPIRSPNLSRCALVDEAVVPTLYRACWVQNKNMSDDAVLVAVLDEAGFDGKALLARAKTPEIKQQLADNTKEAIDAGFCGAPTYRVFHRDASSTERGRNQGWKQFGSCVWGQDDTALVQDLISGWDEDGSSREVAKIEAIEATNKARLEKL
ncbi:thioredoxin-like protein [Microdochium trichocladiopsis]|uniref:Thioredoxin-like protein n=1 Tax=Microdochium trichocladiopsis TaxID=1682393 RepID=A0A9P8XWP4_9PEZI|nr:thioredoxin-like protein [Microdochium trichocladiopsis]KAH7024629.1 thioredoxin-like protein [Microdochium trichocladiopsis]